MTTDRAYDIPARTLPRPGEPDPRRRLLAVAEPRHDFLLALFAPPAITAEATDRPVLGRHPKFRTGDFP